MKFASRSDAGLKLGLLLRERGLHVDLVLGLPRGGVLVAAEVARVLQCPLDVLVVRKIGHPWHREFAIGAMAEYGVILLDERVVGPNALLRSQVDAVIREEEKRLEENQLKFHLETCVLAGRSVLLVDDGLATGATTEAAVLSARRQGASQVAAAAPVASTNSVERLKRVADRVDVLVADPHFDAVGRYYLDFPQIEDQEVLDRLKSPSN